MRTVLFVLAFALAVSAAPPSAEEIRELFDDGSPRVVREVVRGEDGEAINHGPYRSWWPGGKLASEGRYETGERIGPWSFRWENGRRKEEGEYAGGLRTGTWKLYRERGGKEAEGDYVEGRRNGKWTWWTPGNSIDRKRSGIYSFVRLEHEDGSPRCAGNSFRDRKDGPWEFFWPGGRRMAECAFVDGVIQGELRYWHPDGSLEPDLISGVYRDGRRLRPLAAPPVEDEQASEASESAALPLLASSERPELLLLEWIDGAPESSALARAELVRLGREAFPGLLNLLSETDLAAPLAGALHEALAEICGGLAYPWSDGDSPEDLARRRLAVQRWRTFWVAYGEDPVVWDIDLRLTAATADLAVEETILYRIPLPLDVATAGIPSGKAQDAGYGSNGRFGVRIGGSRNVRAMGGSGTTGPLEEALRWLVEQQEPDGRWDCAAHGGHPLFEVGASAQALLALLGAGHTPAVGEHREAVARGVLWLIDTQDRETGRIVTARETAGGEIETNPEALYEHLLATWTLAEAALHADSPALARATQRAVDHLLAARDSNDRWEHGAGSPHGDTSITIGVLLPMLAALEAGVEVPPGVFDAVEGWIEEISDDKSGRARPLAPGDGEGPRFSPDRGEDVTGAVLLARFFLGQDPEAQVLMVRQANQLTRSPARWKAKSRRFDLYALRDTTYALFQTGGKHWKAWNAEMKKAVLDAQVQKGDERGSWNPVGPYGASGGRVLSTALMAQTLEVYFRYGHVRGATGR